MARTTARTTAPMVTGAGEPADLGQEREGQPGGQPGPEETSRRPRRVIMAAAMAVAIADGSRSAEFAVTYRFGDTTGEIGLSRELNPRWLTCG